MFCRHCGRELSSDAMYCSGCGVPVGSIPSADDGKGKGSGSNPIKVLVLVVVVLVACAALLIVMSDVSEPSVTKGSVTISGGLVNEDIAIDDDGLEFTGSGDVSWAYLDTSLPYLELNGSEYSVREHTMVDGPSLSVPSPGVYDVLLIVDGTERYHGVMILDGEISRTYEWTAAIGGYERSFSVDLTYTLSEYLAYSDDDAIRYSVPTLSDSRFVVTDGPIFRLSSALADEYRSVFGYDAPTEGQDYADYLLSFVQCTIAYPDPVTYSDGMYVSDEDGSGDLYLYGVSEYWAYPIEVLHRSSGDCEDTSFLLCSILSVSGYDSAIVMMPSHMMVAVELESFGFRPVVGGLVPTYKKVVGHEYNIYFCETTYNRFVPVGYMASGLHDKVMSEVEDVTFVNSVLRWSYT